MINETYSHHLGADVKTKYSFKRANYFLSPHLLKLCRKKDDLALKGTSLLSNLPILLV